MIFKIYIPSNKKQNHPFTLMPDYFTIKGMKNRIGKVIGMQVIDDQIEFTVKIFKDKEYIFQLEIETD